MKIEAADIVLIEPTADYKRAVLEYRDEFLRNDEMPHGSAEVQNMTAYEVWLQACIDGKDVTKIPADRVVATQYLAICKSNHRLVGMLQIRHELNEHLRVQGGHIGYSVRKSERRKGYATQMLQRALQICHGLGIQQVLLTCDPNNLGSAAVIKANGGEFQKQVVMTNGVRFDQYHIATE